MKSIVKRKNTQIEKASEVIEGELVLDEMVWYGHALHFICGTECRFHLGTLVNRLWVVSTVGELWGDRQIREIHASIHDPGWFWENVSLKGDFFDAAYMERFGYQDIGMGRKYETMVFTWNKKFCSGGCGIPDKNLSSIDFEGYNKAEDARLGHMKLVKKWMNIHEVPKNE